MNRFRSFMQGRYGVDQFGRALIVISLICSFATIFTRVLPLYILCYIPLAYAIFRLLSRNILKRSQENMVYNRISSAFRNKVKQIKLDLIGTKTHKYYHCPQCKQSIRVPRDKGKIAITCPKCRREFVKRT